MVAMDGYESHNDPLHLPAGDKLTSLAAEMEVFVMEELELPPSL
jgi:hypothetical protein